MISSLVDLVEDLIYLLLRYQRGFFERLHFGFIKQLRFYHLALFRFFPG
jgi:hypothetical protein